MAKEFERAPLPADGVPEQICEACAGGALFHHPTQVAAVYCEHSQCGAELPWQGSWHITENITRLEFQEQLTTELVVKEVLDRRKNRAN
jgi:hypothetical protein